MARVKQEFDDEDTYKFIQYLFYILNTVFFIGGSTLFAIGIYVSYDENMTDIMRELEMGFYYAGTAVLIIASSIVVLNSFVGCCAVFAGSHRAIYLYQFLTVVSFILLLGGSAYLLQNGLEGSNLYPYMQDKMLQLIYSYMTSVEARRSVDIVQTLVGCCGSDSAFDYVDINVPVPNTCRDTVSGNNFGDSCPSAFSWYIEQRTGWMCGIALGVCFWQIFAVIISVYAYIYIEKLRQQSY